MRKLTTKEGELICKRIHGGQAPGNRKTHG